MSKSFGAVKITGYREPLKYVRLIFHENAKGEERNSAFAILWRDVPCNLSVCPSESVVGPKFLKNTVPTLHFQYLDSTQYSWIHS